MANATFSSSELTAQKQELLLALYKTSSDEMSWRRTAGYRTVILGLGYCGIILTVVACHPLRSGSMKASLAGVIALAAIFGAGYLLSNYQKYMSAVKRMVLIEEQFGAYESDFLGSLGALMPAGRRSSGAIPLLKNPICIGSIVAFVAGGLVTAAAVLAA